jgi:short-subunit dehydrogenase
MPKSRPKSRGFAIVTGASTGIGYYLAKGMRRARL